MNKLEKHIRTSGQCRVFMRLEVIDLEMPPFPRPNGKTAKSVLNNVSIFLDNHFQ